MDIKAFKMDGLGNDFVIIDNRQTITNLTKEQIIKICDRKFIGCDQLILIKKNDISDASLEFYNSDGGMSGACGNGTRCIADLLGKENNKKEIVLTTLSGKLKSNIVGENGKVIAIEPSPPNFQHLKKNLEIQNTENVDAYNFAAGDKDGEINFLVYEESNGSFTIPDGETKKEKWNRGLDIFIESVIEPDPALRACAHNQKCYHELMDVREDVLNYLKTLRWH